MKIFKEFREEQGNFFFRIGKIRNDQKRTEIIRIERKRKSCCFKKKIIRSSKKQSLQTLTGKDERRQGNDLRT